jgi:hypothetical protein
LRHVRVVTAVTAVTARVQKGVTSGWSTRECEIMYTIEERGVGG